MTSLLWNNIQIEPDEIGEGYTYVEFYDIGETVGVYIANDNPKDFLLNNIFEMWLTPILFGVLGSIGCFLFFIFKKI